MTFYNTKNHVNASASLWLADRTFERNIVNYYTCFLPLHSQI